MLLRRSTSTWSDLLIWIKFKARVVDLSLVRGSQQTPSHPCAISSAATYSPNPASKTSSGGTRESLQLRIVA